MATSVWKGMITFGLVSIPIRLFAAARSERISLNQLHSVCNQRVKQPLFCPQCNRNVERSEIVKGYEYEKDQYVLIEPEELQKITPASGQAMEILSFLNEADVDPVYFDSSYFALPEPHAEKPYVLLMKALESTKKVGVAKVTMHQREYTVFIRAQDNGLTLHTMFYANEINHVEGYGKNYEVNLRPEEIKLADQLVESLAAPFDAKQYKDEYQEQLNALIESKLEGKAVTVQTHVSSKAPVIDMMDALKKSLAAKQAPAAVAEAPAPIAPAKPKPVRVAPPQRARGKKAS
jgi:DNA end-binding protein Ku